MAKKRKTPIPNEGETSDFASPACYAHEVDPTYMMAPERTKRLVPKDRRSVGSRGSKKRKN